MEMSYKYAPRKCSTCGTSTVSMTCALGTCRCSVCGNTIPTFWVKKKDIDPLAYLEHRQIATGLPTRRGGKKFQSKNRVISERLKRSVQASE